MDESDRPSLKLLGRDETERSLGIGRLDANFLD